METKRKPRRDRYRCAHHFISAFDGSHKCGMFVEFAGGMKVHMTRDCKGVCGDYNEEYFTKVVAR